MNQEQERPAETLLFVDDDANILSALERLFWPLGYTILTATGGEQALALIEKQPVDLVISDMRMPQMTGAEVLAQIRCKYPDTVRILLTGYSDMSSTIAAINRAEIYRYIAKPWNDEDIVMIVRDALERKFLRAEKQRLEVLTLQQNDELQALNSSLEDKVRQRTEQLRCALKLLDDAHEQLKKDYFTTIRVFANLMELRRGTMAGHSRRVAQLCRSIADKMQLPETESQTIETAALLHNIGKIGLADFLLDKPYAELSQAERAKFNLHPLRAAAALLALDPLREAAELIRHHLDNYDGQGNHSGLSGDNLPLGARILHVASDYDALQQGLISHDKQSPEQALNTIRNGKNMHYDPNVVDAFCEMMLHAGSYSRVVTEFQVSSSQLYEGMLLARDAVTDNGTLLLLSDSQLNAGHIRQIREFEQSSGEMLTIYTNSI